MAFSGNILLQAAKPEPEKKSRKMAGPKSELKKKRVAGKSKGKAAPVKAATPKAEESAARVPVSKGSVSEKNADAELGDVRHYPYKLNTALGINVVAGLGSAFHIGAQFGHAMWEGVPFYIGPDIGFSLFSPGSLITASFSAWYELRIYGAPRLSMSLGAGLGPAIASSTPQFGSVTYQAFLEGCIVQQINDIASVRGQFRPTFVGGYVGFNGNLNVQFRFQ